MFLISWASSVLEIYACMPIPQKIQSLSDLHWSKYHMINPTGAEWFYNHLQVFSTAQNMVNYVHLYMHIKMLQWNYTCHFWSLCTLITTFPIFQYSCCPIYIMLCTLNISNYPAWSDYREMVNQVCKFDPPLLLCFSANQSVSS